MARISAADRNRRKRERKKHQNNGINSVVTTTTSHTDPTIIIVSDQDERPSTTVPVEFSSPSSETIEIEYVVPELPEIANSDGSYNSNTSPLNDALASVRRFQAREASIIQTDESIDDLDSANSNADADDEISDDIVLSKRKLRDMTRPTVANLKRRVQRPDLVEAHDITATDPEFLIQLKSIPNTVPVPRHWGRKRKYLQGKRIGYDKQPYQLPNYLVNTGITELRDTVMDAEKQMSAKQKNRARVQVKLGAIDVDYRTLHDAFFKYQTKPSNLTKFGDVYYEGKELENRKMKQAGQPLSTALRMALGMSSPLVPPPWLIQMQRYGPPPSYPSLHIAGLNAPLPDPSCQYGYHPNGWGKPPIDIYGRPLYGGNPFDPPGSGSLHNDDSLLTIHNGEFITSNGKTISKSAFWGALATGTVQQTGDDDDDEDNNEASDEEDMEESSVEEEGEAKFDHTDGIESTVPLPTIPTNTGPIDLRKSGIDTPMSMVATAALPPPPPPKQLYQVIEQKEAPLDANAVFASDTIYTIPPTATPIDGAESVLSKVAPSSKETNGKQRHQQRGKANDYDDDDDEAKIKNFKF
jgi:splicing factor 3B subunit 2